MRNEMGFTLIELSIVLVIIGLIVGGILTGQDLIDSAAQRAQIAQIEKYNTAVRTFQNKFGYLPGDIPDPIASNFGFPPRGTLAGQGDGNGIIEAEGSCSTSGNPNGYTNGCGELAMLWVDLSTAGLIDAGIAASVAGYPSPTTHGNATLTSNPSVYQWIPSAKLQPQSNFVYLFSHNGTNYFAVSSVTSFTWMVHSTANPGLTVQQAYNIDSKIDDGLPQSGSVTTCYTNYEAGGFHYGWVWAAGGLNVGWPGTQGCNVSTTAAAYVPTNCYDNNGTGGTQKYSLTQNANVQNCALSFRFQ